MLVLLFLGRFFLGRHGEVSSVRVFNFPLIRRAQIECAQWWQQNCHHKILRIVIAYVNRILESQAPKSGVSNVISTANESRGYFV